MKNLCSAAFAAIMVTLLSCVGCHSTHFARKDFQVESADGSKVEQAKQCSSTRYGDDACFEDTTIKDKSGMGVGYGSGLYPTGMIPPAVQPVHYERMILVPEGEWAAEGIPGGSVHYDPATATPPADTYATKDQVAAVARKVKQLDDAAKKKSEDKSEEKTSEKEGK